MVIVGTLSFIRMGTPLDLGYGGLPGQRTPRTGDLEYIIQIVWLPVLLLVGWFNANFELKEFLFIWYTDHSGYY